MANQIYPLAREGFGLGEIVWKETGGSVIKAHAVRGGAYNAGHKFLSQLTAAGASIVATATLASKTIPLGVATCADWSFGTVAAGLAIPAIVIVQTSAVGGGADLATTAQRLICWRDTDPGLPYTPIGQPMDVDVDATLGLFTL